MVSSLHNNRARIDPQQHLKVTSPLQFASQLGRGCFDPETETCCAEFSSYCTDPQVCVSNGHCCPAGKSLCGLDDCYDPKTEVTNPKTTKDARNLSLPTAPGGKGDASS